MEQQRSLGRVAWYHRKWSRCDEDWTWELEIALLCARPGEVRVVKNGFLQNPNAGWTDQELFLEMIGIIES